MDIDTSRVLEIELSRWKNWARLAASGLFVIVCAIWFAEAMGWIAIGKLASDSSEAWISGLILVLFGSIFVAVAGHLYRLRGPVVTLSPEGFRDLRIAAETVPWSVIEGVSHQQNRIGEMIVLEIAPAAEAKLNFTILARVLRGVHGLFGVRGLIVTAAGTSIGEEDLLAAIVAYGRAWHGSGASTKASHPPANIDVSRTLEFRLAWQDWLGSLAMGVFGMFLSGLMLADAAGWFGPEAAIGVWISVPIALVLCLGSALALGEFYKYRGAVVTLSAQGFRDVRLSAEIVPWNAIQEISVEYGPLVLQIAPETAASLNLSPAGLNGFHQAGGLVIDPKGLTVSLKDLFEATVGYAQAWHEANSSAGMP